MAFSMFLSKSACSSKMFSQQIMKLATQATIQRTVAASLPASTIAVKQANTTPILNSVRSFRTTPVHLSGEKSHDHAKLWIIEKMTTALMVPLVPMALIMPNKILDCVLAVLITAHSFWGLEAIAVDYARAAVVGPALSKIALALVYIMSIATLGGLFYLISHDIGLGNTVRQFWAVKSEKNA